MLQEPQHDTGSFYHFEFIEERGYTACFECLSMTLFTFYISPITHHSSLITYFLYR